jgi:uroporphyrinogen-III synthase
MTKYILVTRPEPQAELTALSLREVGFKPLIAPAITLKALPDATMQVAALNHHTDGVIVTSQFALQVLDSGGLHRGTPLYVTGKMLEELATDYGFSNVTCANNDATSLLHLLMTMPDVKRQLLTIVHGNHIAVELATPLQDAGFRINRQPLYHSRAARALPQEAMTALKRGEVSSVLFYSAFTARCFMELIHQADLDSSLRDVTAVCLSSAITDALPALLWGARISGDSPTTSDILVALRSVLDAACVSG